MIVNFKYYLHDDYSREEFKDEILENNLNLHEDRNIDLDALMEKIGRPFYEVTLNCTLDTDTGEVKLVNATL